MKFGDVMKKIALPVIILSVYFNIYSQSFVNPSDQFYKDVNCWEISGIIENVPQISPYSIPVIKSILENVLKNGSDKDIQRAQYYLDKLENEGFNVSFEGDADFTWKSDSCNDRQDGTVRFTGALNLLPDLYMNYDFGVTGNHGLFSIPEYNSVQFDMVDDPTRIKSIEVNLNFNNLLSIGNDYAGVYAGISRSAFGQFPDESIVFDSSTFHAPYIAAYVIQPKWAYTQSLYMISASNNCGQKKYPQKFLNLHEVTLHLLPNLSFSYYETIVSGRKTDFQYLLPTPYMVSQAFGGFVDNLQMGIGITYKPIKGLKLTGDLYVDDVSANDIVKLKFDTKLIIAGQLTAQYVPSASIFRRVYTEALMVGPRMYAHSDINLNNDGTYSAAYINYQNYTHTGECIATNIWPNSVACNIGTEMNILSTMKLSFSGKFVCNANVNETLEKEEAIKYLSANPSDVVCITDGSVFNYAGFTKPNGKNSNPKSYSSHFPFLEQETKKYVFQFDSRVSYDFPLSDSITCSISLKNIFEYIKNDGVQNPIFNPLGDGTVDFQATDADYQNALDNWHSNIIPDTFRDYLTISAKVAF
ncbi:MAG: hypothetical protein KBT02_02680 [Treponema sp.]|nr:hypothetical protein [Candidatus Treponema caballi]